MIVRTFEELSSTGKWTLSADVLATPHRVLVPGTAASRDLGPRDRTERSQLPWAKHALLLAVDLASSLESLIMSY